MVPSVAMLLKAMKPRSRMKQLGMVKPRCFFGVNFLGRSCGRILCLTLKVTRQVTAHMMMKCGRGGRPRGATMAPSVPPATPPRLHMPWNVDMMGRL